LRKKSGSSSGGIIRRGGLLPFPDLLGLPMTNQRIAAIGAIGTKTFLISMPILDLFEFSLVVLLRNLQRRK
jgi:hypothetical protein